MNIQGDRGYAHCYRCKENGMLSVIILLYTNCTLIALVASRKAMPYLLCSSRPVAIVRMLGSKMMSVGSNPTFSTSK